MRRVTIYAAILSVLVGIAAPSAIYAGQLATQSPVMSGFGKLAYVWRGHLYFLDASGRRQITFRGLASNPTWSRDGRSLTYQLAASSSASTYQTWSIRADGTGAHRVAGSACAICRSPNGRRLVVEEQGIVRRAHGNSPAQLRVPAITIVNSASGRVLRRYSLPARRGDLVVFRRWWADGHAILFQIDPGASASIAADGLKLYSLTLADGRMHQLAHAFAYADWQAVHGSRALIVAGGDRSNYFNKRLMLCTEAGSCHTVAGGAKTIAVDPAWSPTGTEIAWVQAPAHPGLYGPGSAPTYRRWDAERTLWTASPSGAHATLIGSAGGGIADPQWTRDGRGLLFVRDNALWFDAHPGAGNPQIIARLFPSGQLPQFGGYWDDLFYYGHVEWESQFAWWQP